MNYSEEYYSINDILDSNSKISSFLDLSFMNLDKRILEDLNNGLQIFVFSDKKFVTLIKERLEEYSNYLKQINFIFLSDVKEENFSNEIATFESYFSSSSELSHKVSSNEQLTLFKNHPINCSNSIKFQVR